METKKDYTVGDFLQLIRPFSGGKNKEKLTCSQVRTLRDYKRMLYNAREDMAAVGHSFLTNGGLRSACQFLEKIQP